MRAHRNGWWLVAGMLAAMVLLGACGDDGGSGGAEATTTTASPEVQRGGKVVYGLIAETNGWDPASSQWGQWSLIVANTLCTSSLSCSPFPTQSRGPRSKSSTWINDQRLMSEQ